MTAYAAKVIKRGSTPMKAQNAGCFAAIRAIAKKFRAVVEQKIAAAPCFRHN
jgi:hypothetical protein